MPFVFHPPSRSFLLEMWDYLAEGENGTGLVMDVAASPQLLTQKAACVVPGNSQDAHSVISRL